MSDLEKVKQLRKSTGAGFKDCNAALKESDGDLEKAAEILRVKGIAKASKKMSRTASEGLALVKENKGEMASVVYKFYNQMKSGNIQLFENSDAYLRDFVYIDDVIEWNLFFYRNPEYSGIYNVGTGVERSFEDIANIFKNKYNAKINYIPMPEHLREKYQEYTKSDNSKSLEVYNHKYNTLEEGVEKYLNYLESC